MSSKYLTILGVFSMLFLWGSLSAFALFFGLRLFVEQVVMYPLRMVVYTESNPAPYLVSLGAVFAVAGTLLVVLCSRLTMLPRIAALVAGLVFVVLVFAPLGALWWIYHDIQAGYLPKTSTLIWNIKRGIGDSFGVMQFVCLYSLPLSSLGAATGLTMLYITADFYLQRLAKVSLKTLLWQWSRLFLFAYLPLMVFQLVMLSWLVFSSDSPAMSFGQLLLFCGWYLLRGVKGLLFFPVLLLIAVPFIAWMRWDNNMVRKERIYLPRSD